MTNETKKMSLNLTIDRGNTLTKVAAWEGKSPVAAETFASADVESIVEMARQLRPRYAMMSSVAGAMPELAAALKAEGIELEMLTAETPLPITLGYDTPETLGADRIAAVAGAQSLLPGADLLVVDAGTAVTYDRLTADGCFAGGNIAPGIEMRLRALHSFTKRLPEIDFRGEQPGEWGTDTRRAMINGAVNGVVAETLYYRSLLPPRAGIVITGGDCELLAGLIEFRTIKEPHLVTMGLNAILNFNHGGSGL